MNIMPEKGEAVPKSNISSEKKMAGVKRIKNTFLREKQLWLICIPIILWVLLFAYYPMYGLIMAFIDYEPGRAILDSDWVGFKHFIEFFQSPDFWMVLRNTLVISGLGIVFGFPAPILLALLLHELKYTRFKKFVQTVSYLPHFMSWVVVASIVFVTLGNEGVFNQFLMSIGIIDRPVSFLGEGKYFWGVITGADIWKGIGWSSIIYLSAIAGVDSQLYEAGKMDGLGRFGLIWHVIIPGIRPTIVILMILGISGILNAGFEQQLLIGNVQTREYWEVFDTYSYRYGIQLGNYSYATAVGLFKSIIGLILLVGANKFCKKFFDTSVY
ncbi:ABC transporter permease subunit [Viridibacillus arvi]